MLLYAKDPTFTESFKWEGIWHLRAWIASYKDDLIYEYVTVLGYESSRLGKEEWFKFNDVYEEIGKMFHNSHCHWFTGVPVESVVEEDGEVLYWPNME